MTPGCDCPVCTEYRWPVRVQRALYWATIIATVTGALGLVLSELELIRPQPALFGGFNLIALLLFPFHGWLGTWIRYRVVLFVQYEADRRGLPVSVFVRQAEESRPDGEES